MRHLRILAIPLLMHLCVLSQDNNSIPVQTLSPGVLSPDAASLGKFGNIPVGYSTGVPDITIPLYEIKIGKIDLPISLDYHAGGIRVDEVASSTGLGWALNGIYRITRSVSGLPDERSDGYLFTPSADQLQPDATAYWQDVYANRDFSPDVFSYSIPGQSGQFIFNKDQTVFQTPLSENHIEFFINDGYATTFKITDPKGIAWYFEQTEAITIVPYGANTSAYVNSWVLTRIVDQNQQDVVTFTYEQTCGAPSEQSRNDIFSVGASPTTSAAGQQNIPFVTNMSFFTGISHSSELFIKQIDWRGGRIVFNNACDRQDRLGEKRIQSLDIYSNSGPTNSDASTLKEVRKISLTQSYFFYNSTKSNPSPYTDNDERNYRLRLDAVTLTSMDGADDPQVYTMTYNNTNMCSIGSCGQDLWGFNNGKFNNQSLMPIQTVVYNGTSYNIGNANRDPEAGFMQAGVISSIQYPTKGKSVFEFEPHRYYYSSSIPQAGAVYAGASSASATSFTSTFTYDATWLNVRYAINISAFSYNQNISIPVVTLTDQTDGTQLLQVINPDGSKGFNTGTIKFNTGGLIPTLVVGHAYAMTVNVYANVPLAGGSTPVVYANMMVSYEQNVVQDDIRSGGGLRIKSITRYDDNGNFAGKDSYEYGRGTGYGQLITPAIFTAVHQSYFTEVVGVDNCSFFTGPQCVTYFSNSSLPISQLSGSPVQYDFVTKYQESASGGKGNGKTDYSFILYQDQPVFTGSFDISGVTLISSVWRNGFPNEEDTWKSTGVGSYSLVQAKNFIYTIDRSTNFNTVKVDARFIHSGCMYKGPASMTNDYNFTYYPLPSGIMHLQRLTTTLYDDNNGRHEVRENYYYDNSNYLFQTRKELISSTGAASVETYKYPGDLAAAGNVYASMVTRNIKAPLVRVTTTKNSAVTVTNSNFSDVNGDSKLLLPQTIDQQIGSYSDETRISISRYDSYGNVLQEQKSNDMYGSYIWDYQSTLLIASAKNASYNDIAYTSFEADGSGNWTVASPIRNTTGGYTGEKAYDLGNGGISKGGLDPSRTYIVSYWSKSSSAQVNGTGSTALLQKNGWYYFRQTLAAGSTSVTVTGAVTIDELRLCPSDAQMLTYTHHPLIGVTSRADADDRVTYYEYDGFGRLKLARDEDGNILKTYQYHYKQ